MADSGVDYAVDAPLQAALPIVGDAALFPVRRIYCVGRNYAAHAREMGHDPDREEPFFFHKSPDSILLSGGEFPYPPGTSDVHHEIELVVALGREGADIAVDRVAEHISQRFSNVKFERYGGDLRPGRVALSRGNHIDDEEAARIATEVDAMVGATAH